MTLKRILMLLLFGIMASANTGAQLNRSGDERPTIIVEQNALKVVARRIAAYNAHNIGSFLAAHAEDVQIFAYPDRKLGEGRAHLRSIFESQFDRGSGRIIVNDQFARGNRVVSDETVTIDAIAERYIAIYTTEKGVITSFRLIEADE